MSPLNDPYALTVPNGGSLETIGAGAQGQVFVGCAYLNGEKRQVAFKVHNKACDEKELNILRRVRHDNIVEFFGMVEIRVHGSPMSAIVLEFCQSTLRSELDSPKSYPLNKDVFVKYAGGIAQGIHYLHGLPRGGIIHRDLKPENVLIDSEGRAKLCDFGIARDIPAGSNVLTRIGTLPYMSPEMHGGNEGQPRTEKVDVWSYGVVFWEMLTGTRPYKDMEERILMFAIGSDKARLPYYDGSKLESVRNLLNQSLVPRVHDRASMGAILAGIATVAEELAKYSDEAFKEECLNWRETAESGAYFVDVRKAGQTEMEKRESIAKALKVLELDARKTATEKDRMEQLVQRTKEGKKMAAEHANARHEEYQQKGGASRQSSRPRNRRKY